MWLLLLLLNFIVLLLVVRFVFMQGPDCRRIQTLVRQVSRWATAARQDTNPLVAVLHANYAVGYLESLTDTYSQNEIERCSGIDLEKFSHEIFLTQHAITTKVIKICPQFSTQHSYLAKLAGEGV